VELQGAFVDTVNEAVLMYALNSKNHEIIKAAIGFIKVMMVVCPHVLEDIGRPSKSSSVESLTDAMDKTMMIMEEEDDNDVAEEDETFHFVNAVVKACVKWTTEHRSHFKVPCRNILERMIRKCGYDTIANVFPGEHHKLLTNLRKRHEQQEKKKHQSKSQTGGRAEKTEKVPFEALIQEKEVDANIPDDEADEDLPTMLQELVSAVSTVKKGNMGSKHHHQLRFREAEDSVDLLNAKAARNMVRGPTTQHKPSLKKPNEFKVSETGKLMIEDSEEEENEGDMAMRQKRADVEKAFREAQSTFSYSADGKRIKFKRKHEASGNGSDDEDVKDGSKKVSTSAAKKHGQQQKLKGGKKEKKKKAPVKGNLEPYDYIPLSRPNKKRR
jgi:ribosomal RNA-processing protein 12